MRKYDISDEEKDRIAQRNAEHYCKLCGIKDPDKKSEVLKAMRQACDEIVIVIDLESRTAISMKEDNN